MANQTPFIWHEPLTPDQKTSGRQEVSLINGSVRPHGHWDTDIYHSGIHQQQIPAQDTVTRAGMMSIV